MLGILGQQVLEAACGPHKGTSLKREDTGKEEAAAPPAHLTEPYLCTVGT